MGYLLSVKPGDPWLPGLVVAYVVSYLALLMSADDLRKTLDPGLRRDDVLKTVGLKIVIPAKAGIQCLFLTDSHWLSAALLTGLELKLVWAL